VRSQPDNGAAVADLAIVVVSTNEAHWLERCLSTVFEQAGGAVLDVIVVDNSSTDGTRELVESRFPQARVVTSPNRGFSYGNNRGLEQANARYVLLLNPDTEVLSGSFGELLERLDEQPDVGLAGVRQLTGDGTLWPTIRRFPSASRALGEAFVSERWPIHPRWSGERVLAAEAYAREGDCDWTSGSFMLARREAILSAGMLDERSFIYSEEPDLCLRIKQAGWRVRHLPSMTIVHHASKGGVRPRMVAQDAFARRQYAHKHFGAIQRKLYLSATGLRHLLRAGGRATPRREGARLALRTMLGRVEPPFKAPPATALQPAIPASGVPQLARDASSKSAPPQQPLFS
jgi:N-acetylglucosaminyl-diphospho-decaprenol L-rhamnosyltransferase